jgi:carbon storage regulator CsrA
MLVLARKEGEKIILRQAGKEDIEVCIVFINYQKGQVRVGINAPSDVIALREEITEGQYAKLVKGRSFAREEEERKRRSVSAVRSPAAKLSKGLPVSRKERLPGRDEGGTG